MTPPDKLPLVKTAMRMLVDTLTPERPRRDRRVRRARAAWCCRRRPAIARPRFTAPSPSSSAGGSTNGARGHQARLRHRQPDVHQGRRQPRHPRTDGDFNVGVTSQGELIRLIEEKREHGIFLSVLGFGRATSRTRRWRSSPTRATATTPTSTRCTRRGGCSRRSGRDARHGREGRQDPGRVQPASRRRLPPDRLREPAPAPRGLQRRQEGRRRNRRRPHGDRAVRDRPAGRADRRARRRSAEVSGSGRSRPVGARRSDELMTVKMRYKKPDGDTSQLISVRRERSRRASPTPNLGFAAAVARVRHAAAQLRVQGSGDAGRRRRRSRGNTAARIPTAIAPSSSACSTWPPRSMRRMMLPQSRR